MSLQNYSAFPFYIKPYSGGLFRLPALFFSERFLEFTSDLRVSGNTFHVPPVEPSQLQSYPYRL
jgi:hypothetical protein